MLRILSGMIPTERGSHAKLAQLTGISAAQLSKYLSGQKSMTVAEFDSICRALGREPWEVMKIAQDGNHTL